MRSTIEYGNSIVDIVHGIYKELPDWYGISDIGFVWHGTQADPEIEYKGHRINSVVIEDTMWERWIYDNDGNLLPERENDDDGFSRFMRDNADEVRGLIDFVMENEGK